MLNVTRRQQIVSWGLTPLLTLLLAVPALAQNQPGNGRGPNYQDLPEFKAKGTIKALAPGFLQVEVSDKEEWIVQVLPGNRGVRFVGSAEPDWLMPGMWVNFTTRFSPKGQALEPVKLLMVFTPGNNRGREEGPLQPGVKPLTNPGADVSFAGEKVKPKDDTVLCEVTGQIQGLGKGAIAVLAGNVPIQVALADEASISVDLADLRPARVGDKIEVNGRTIAPGQGIGMRVEVKGATPLSNKLAPAEGKSKLPAKETKPAATGTPNGKSPTTDKKKLPLLGKKSSTTEKQPEEGK
jgi:hypothetical protein